MAWLRMRCFVALWAVWAVRADDTSTSSTSTSTTLATTTTAQAGTATPSDLLNTALVTAEVLALGLRKDVGDTPCDQLWGDAATTAAPNQPCDISLQFAFGLGTAQVWNHDDALIAFDAITARPDDVHRVDELHIELKMDRFREKLIREANQPMHNFTHRNKYLDHHVMLKIGGKEYASNWGWEPNELSLAAAFTFVTELNMHESTEDEDDDDMLDANHHHIKIRLKLSLSLKCEEHLYGCYCHTECYPAAHYTCSGQGKRVCQPNRHPRYMRWGRRCKDRAAVETANTKAEHDALSPVGANCVNQCDETELGEGELCNYCGYVACQYRYKSVNPVKYKRKMRLAPCVLDTGDEEAPASAKSTSSGAAASTSWMLIFLILIVAVVLNLLLVVLLYKRPHYADYLKAKSAESTVSFDNPIVPDRQRAEAGEEASVVLMLDNGGETQQQAGEPSTDSVQETADETMSPMALHAVDMEDEGTSLI